MPIRLLVFSALLFAATWNLSESLAESPSQTNVLLITVDDMSQDSIGVYGCTTPDITPHIDKLASEGVRFVHSHVTIAVCQPCRAVWLTGRYPHLNGAFGFQTIVPGIPTLPETLKQHGYFTGAMAKLGHVLPSRKEAWDVKVTAQQLQTGRNPQKYYQHAKTFFLKAKESKQPFFLMANAQDPHRPFARSSQEQQNRQRKGKKNAKNNAKNKANNKPNQNSSDKSNQKPNRTVGQKSSSQESAKARVPFPLSRMYQADEVDFPGFLPDLPDVRKEMAQYFSSVHRADEVTGAVLKALKETGFAENTCVIFLSDHGMALPFSKTNCYFHSTRTPWIVRWPGQIEAGKVNKQAMVSGIDLTPTILDITAIPIFEGVNGRSVLPLLKGEQQPQRDVVFTQFHKTAGKRSYEMRSVVHRRFGYIYNDWADGTTIFKNESQSGLTMRAMVRAAEKDPAIAKRVKLFLYRVPEEFYDYENDPDAIHNLIDDPEHHEEIQKLQEELLSHLRNVKDPLLPKYQTYLRKRDDTK